MQNEAYKSGVLDKAHQENIELKSMYQETVKQFPDSAREDLENEIKKFKENSAYQRLYNEDPKAAKDIRLVPK